MKLCASSSLLAVAILCVNAINIGSNLDFQADSKAKPKLIETVYKIQNHHPQQHKSRTSEQSGQVHEINVVCEAGGCNATNTTTANNNGMANTADIVVHVKTSIAEATSRTTPNDEEDIVPDVPIVIGTGNPHSSPAIQPEPNRFVPSIGIEMQYPPPHRSTNRLYPSQWQNNHFWKNQQNFRRNNWGSRPWYPGNQQQVEQQNCICPPLAVWRPAAKPYNFRLPLNNPGKQINDKLAPLN